MYHRHASTFNSLVNRIRQVNTQVAVGDKIPLTKKSNALRYNKIPLIKKHNALRYNTIPLTEEPNAQR